MDGNFLNIQDSKQFQKAKKLLKQAGIEFQEHLDVFGVVMWNDDDLKQCLKDSGIKRPTKKQLVEVRDCIDAESMCERMIERGWMEVEMGVSSYIHGEKAKHAS